MTDQATAEMADMKVEDDPEAAAKKAAKKAKKEAEAAAKKAKLEAKKAKLAEMEAAKKAKEAAGGGDAGKKKKEKKTGVDEEDLAALNAARAVPKGDYKDPTTRTRQPRRLWGRRLSPLARRRDPCSRPLGRPARR